MVGVSWDIKKIFNEKKNFRNKKRTLKNAITLRLGRVGSHPIHQMKGLYGRFSKVKTV
jgi:hypothetical protein